MKLTPDELVCILNELSARDERREMDLQDKNCKLQAIIHNLEADLFTLKKKNKQLTEGIEKEPKQ